MAANNNMQKNAKQQRQSIQTSPPQLIAAAHLLNGANIHRLHALNNNGNGQNNPSFPPLPSAPVMAPNGALMNHHYAQMLHHGKQIQSMSQRVGIHPQPHRMIFPANNINLPL